MDKLDDFAKGARSLVEGMAITIKHMFKEPITVEYPREEAPIAKAQRNAITLIQKEEEAGASHNCIACLQCEKICPSNCISITGDRVEGIATKRPTKFDLNFALCSECGLCVDVCPTVTLGYSKKYDRAGYHRDDFTLDLLEPWREGEAAAHDFLREADAKKKAAAAAKRKAEAEAKAAAAKAKEEAEAKAAAEAPPAADPKPAEEPPKA